MAEPSRAWCDRAAPEGHRRAIERVILSMHHRLASGMSLDDMARAAFISPFHFNRIFRQEVGIPPSHFLSALRIQAAKRLLMSTDERIIDVCLDVGFSSPGTFSRRFKLLVGLPPLQFRRLAARLAAELLPRPDPRLLGGPPGAAIHGRAVAGQDAVGPIFVGLFDSPLPQSRPLSCCYREGPGRFSLAAVPDGDYYLLALGFPEPAELRAVMLGDQAQRAGSTTRPIAIRNGRPAAPIELHLRPAELTDPPVLLTLPWLMTR